MRTKVIIVAAGESRRMQQEGAARVDKCFKLVARRPLITWSIEAFQRAPSVDEIVVVISPRNVKQALGMVGSSCSKVIGLCVGGSERRLSVKNGLSLLGECEIIAVHDAARPCITPKDIERGIAMVREGADGAVPVSPIVDTVKRVRRVGVLGDQEHILFEETVDRNTLMAASTPQIFRAEVLRNAHAMEFESAQTDDAQMVQAAGYQVHGYQLSSWNGKVTMPDDLIMAEAILSRRSGLAVRE